MWWIKAYMQEYILKSWSLVKIGTTVAQKKLFFNLNKIKKRIQASDNGSLDPQQINRIANDLNVSKSEVMEMNSRLHNSDKSINDKIGDDENAELSDMMVCQDSNQEQIAIESQEKQRRESLLQDAISKLNEREQNIIFKRQLDEKKSTLGELSLFYNISRERVRQIEAAAMAKIRNTIKDSL
jgi:RNA polymerase sigma-32 factor